MDNLYKIQHSNKVVKMDSLSVLSFTVNLKNIFPSNSCSFFSQILD